MRHLLTKSLLITALILLPSVIFIFGIKQIIYIYQLEHDILWIASISFCLVITYFITIKIGIDIVKEK